MRARVLDALWRHRLTDRQRTVATVASVAVVTAAAFVAVDRLGFRDLLLAGDAKPERLRDYTFSVWRREPVTEHGFLTFVAPTDFDDGIAYSHFSTVYLLAMYALFRAGALSFVPDLRWSSALLLMAATIVATAVVVVRRTRVHQVGVVASLLPLAAIAYVATEPGYWISAAKFNVDNVYHFSAPILILAAYQIAFRRERDWWFWLPVVAYGVIAPMNAALLVAFLCLKMLAVRERRETLARPTVVLAVVSAAAYLQPIIVSRLLGFRSDNSGWLYRSGLDGDTEFYSNPLEAVTDPHLPRPFMLLVIPAVVLVVQLVWMWRSREPGPPRDATDALFLQLLFSQYVLNLLLFPQSVSVHPYLYDRLLVVPLLLWIVWNFASGSALFARSLPFWTIVVVGLVVFNLTEIAQTAACGVDCWYAGDR